MFCEQCGSPVGENQRFCGTCGRPLGPAGAEPARPGRVASNLRLLGIFWIVLSLFRLLPGLALLGLFSGGFWAFLPPDVPRFALTIMHVIGIALLAIGGLGIAAGWGLLEREPWARMLAIILSFINIVEIPFGTALGIYTLWVLLPAQSEREYSQFSERA